MRLFYIILYYTILIRLPHSTVPIIGRPLERLKEFFVRRIFLKCGKNVNVSKGARFGIGTKIQIGNNSSIGMNCKVPDDMIIGNDVMMGPNVIIFSSNHNFDRTDIPMISQGMRKYPPVVIEDDVWIGANVIVLPGIRIKKGTIVGAGTVLTKEFPEYSIVGGNPGKLLKSRK